MGAEREPWLGAILSILFPGLGQLYARDHFNGGAQLIAGTALRIAGPVLFYSKSGDVVLSIVVSLAGMVFNLYSAIQAWQLVRRGNPEPFESIRRKVKDPWAAVVCSFFVPSLGLFYLKKWGWGILAIGCLIAAAFLDQAFPIPTALQTCIVALVYGGIACMTFRCGHAIRPSPVKKPYMTILCLVGAYYAIDLSRGAISARVASLRPMTSTAMAPTFQLGDRILTAKRFERKFKRGNLVSFRVRGKQQSYVRRVLAVGGERVAVLRDGRITVNEVVPGAPFDQPLYAVLPTETQSWEVLGGEVFVVADNPVHNTDSRHFGPIKTDDINGVPCKIVWPLSRAGPAE